MDYPSNLLAIISSLFLSLLMIYLFKLLANRKSKQQPLLPPQAPGAWPIIGHLPRLRTNRQLTRTFSAMADQLGPIFTIWLGQHRTVVVSGSEVIKECLTTRDKVLASRPESAAGKWLHYDHIGFGFRPYDEFWRDMRKMVVSHLLCSHRMASLLRHVLAEETSAFVNDLYRLCLRKGRGGTSQRPCGGATVGMSELLHGHVLNLNTRLIAGKRSFGRVDEANEEEAELNGELIREYAEASGVIVPSDCVPFLKWFSFLPGLRAEHSLRRISRKVNSLVDVWIEEHKSDQLGKEDSFVARDFMDVMLSVVDNNPKFGYSRDTIVKATSMMLVVAGSDTTSIALSWVVSNLVNQPRALELIQEELDVKVGSERWAEESDMKDLVYLQAVVKETLRMYPPGPLAVPHEAMEDCTLAGYHIPKGARVFLNIWKTQRDPLVWEDPDEFKPERFLVGDKAGLDVSGQHFEFIPFGSGRRSCPGVDFAMEVVHLTLARLVQGFHISASGHVDMTEGEGLTMPRATPLICHISPRLGSQVYQL